VTIFSGSTLAKVAAVAVVQFASGMVAGRPSDPEFYRALKQAPFAPPAWAFAPAWALAKSASSWSLVRVFEQKQMANRNAYLALGVVDAGLYVTFSYVYFRKKSPLLAAVWTCSTAAVTAGQCAIAVRADRPAALGLIPQAMWLCIATPVALYQAANNPGPVIRT
jgi:tryptophan-rich sensory protein